MHLMFSAKNKGKHNSIPPNINTMILHKMRVNFFAPASQMFSWYVKNLPAILNVLNASRNRMFYSFDFLKNSIAKAGIRTIITDAHKAKNGSVVYYKSKSACKSTLTLLNSKGIRKSSL